MLELTPNYIASIQLQAAIVYSFFSVSINTFKLSPFLVCVFVIYFSLIPSFVFSVNNTPLSNPTDDRNRYNSDDANRKTSPVSLLTGLPTITIDKDRQQFSGIEITVLDKSTYQSEFIAYGIVVDLKPLLELRSRYFNAVAAHSIAKIKYEQTEKNITRIQNLHRNKTASTRKLQEHQSLYQSAKAAYIAKRHQLLAIEESALISWGKPLANWILNPESGQFTQLINRQYTLLEITLQAGQTLPEHTHTIYIDRFGQRDKAKKASLVSAAPQADATFQGETFFFQTTSKIRNGMHVTAWIPRQQKPLTGFIIPGSAVIRHLGQQYIYLQSGEQQFSRKKISGLLPVANGYFVQAGISAGDKLVAVGAQMLLSEEFRGLIPDEDDDD